MNVFISYAHKDGASLARRLEGDLSASGFHVWLDRQRLSGGSSWTQEIEVAIDGSQVVLAVLTPGSYVSEMCRAEQLRSLRKGKCVIPIIGLHGTEIPIHLEARDYRDFADENGYDGEWPKLLDDIHQGKTAGLRDGYQHTYVTAPPLPPSYIEREDDLRRLIDSLITDGDRQHIALTALEGMGGIGKTVLAQALCHSSVVRSAFPDGIVWITAGQNPVAGLVTRLREVGKVLRDDLSAYDNELGSVNRYRTVIAQKAALIVVDDVWRVQDIEPFCADSSRSRLLFTTRDNSIASAVGARTHTANLLTTPEAMRMLARWAACDESSLPEEALDLIAETGRLSLAVGMVGAMLRGKPRTFWKSVLAMLRNRDLNRIRVEFPGYAYATLFRAFEVSIGALDSTYRDRYLRLAVVLDDMPIHRDIQRVLWNVSETEAMVTAEHFISLSLAQRDKDPERIVLHDLQLDCVRTYFPDANALTVIHSALRLSSHVILEDPAQFPSQLYGRLTDYAPQSALSDFLRVVVEGTRTPWLRPLHRSLAGPGGGVVQSYRGHLEGVYCVDTSADGRFAVSGSLDQTVRVWDLATGSTLHTMRGHSGTVFKVILTRDARRVVSSSNDCSLRVWDTASGRELLKIDAHSSPVWGLALTPDDSLALSGSSGGSELRAWDLNTGRLAFTLEGHDGWVTDLAVTADGAHVVAAGTRMLSVFSLTTRSVVRRLRGHTTRTVNVAASADGHLLLSGDHDGDIRLWDVTTGSELAVLRGHVGLVTDLMFGASRDQAISTAHDHTIRVWDLTSRAAVRTMDSHCGSLHGLAPLPGERLLGACGDTLRVFDVSVTPIDDATGVHPRGITCLAISPSMHIATAAEDGSIALWDRNARRLRLWGGRSSEIKEMAFSSDGRSLIAAGGDATVRTWDVATEQEVRRLAVPSETKNSVHLALSADGRFAASGDADQDVRLWDLRGGLEVRRFPGLRLHSVVDSGLALSADGGLVLVAVDSGAVRVLHADSGQEAAVLTRHENFIASIVGSVDGAWVLTASFDNTLKLWDLRDGREVRTLCGHTDLVLQGVLNGNTTQAASVSHDGTLKLWDVRSGSVLSTFSPDAEPRCCAFVGSGAIVVGDTSGRLHVLSIMRLDNRRE